MKRCLIILTLFFFIGAEGNNPYKIYLLTKFGVTSQKANYANNNCHIANQTRGFVPRYVIPKGNIFCRMEDKLSRAVKVRIKIGVK